MLWERSWRADPRARELADRHYNRQKVGAKQFVPPGRCLVLVIPNVAFWITSWPFAQYVKHVRAVRQARLGWSMGVLSIPQ